MRWIDTGFALSFRSPKVQGIIRAAFLAIDAVVMIPATVAHRAQLLLFLWLLAHGSVRCKYFIPVLIGLLHRIYLALVLGAIRVAGFVAKTHRRGARCEI